MKPLGEVRTYDELHAALRARAMALNVVLNSANRGTKTIDEWAGLPDRYISKLLAPVPLKSLGKTSLGPTLTVLGVKLVVVEDEEAMKTYTRHLDRAPHTNGSGYASDKVRPIKARKRRGYWRGVEGWAKVMNARRALVTSPAQRKRSARKAAKARWKKPRIVELTKQEAEHVRDAINEAGKRERQAESDRARVPRDRR